MTPEKTRKLYTVNGRFTIKGADRAAVWNAAQRISDILAGIVANESDDLFAGAVSFDFNSPKDRP